MYNWTDEQQSAIDAYGSPVIVSAAAGSGKTAVLVERTIRLLCDSEKNIPADTLLAVTFTNDAAAQMSRKLSAEIDLRADLEPDDPWIQRQQALLRLAEITTINSFCYGLVKDNLSLTEFHSGIRILDENEAAMLCDRALDQVLEREYADDPAETEQLISLFCHENDLSLRAMILKLYGFLRSLPFRDVWAKRAIDRLRSGEAADILTESLKAEAKEEIKLLRSAVSRLKDCAAALEYHSAAQRVFYSNCDLAEAIIDTLKVCSFEDAHSLLEKTEWFKLIGARQTKAEKQYCSELENGIYQSAKDCLDHIKKGFEELAGVYMFSKKTAAEEQELVAKYFERLWKLCAKLDGELMKMKVEKNAVDFADTELMCVSMLVNCADDGTLSRTPLAEEIVKSGRYRVILIDEFQDVNNLQEVIFRAISDADDISEMGKNVFVVGDVKQSIYRFRQASPKIFLKTREQGRSPDSRVRELLLRRNFRSRESILKFCNYVFGSLMSSRVGETEYTADEALIKGADYPSEDPPVEIIAYDSDVDESVKDIEFTAIARRIRQLLDSGALVYDGGAERPCRPSDFCVLTRNNIEASEIKDIFDAEGLKILTNDSSGYLGSREISLLLDLLAVISNPMRDIPLASVLLSPIFGFTDDMLAQLRLLGPEDRLYKTVLAVSRGDCPADEVFREKCSRCVETLKKLGVYASGMTLTRLIRKIYDVTDIFALASAYEDAEKKCANLYLLLEYAKSYEDSSPDGIAGFLRYIEYINKSNGDFEQAMTVTESEDAVNIKTVHRSKGLEYPFVFLCQTGRQFNKKDLNGALQLNSDVGVGLSFNDYSTLTNRKTCFWRQVRRENESELLSEELRLLYVAMTRAKERLIILLDTGEKAAQTAKKYYYEITSPKVPAAVVKRASCTADWLIMALIKHPGFGVMRSRLDGVSYTDPPADDLPEISVIPIPGATERRKTSDKVKIAPDGELVKRISENFQKSPDPRLIQNEAKLTVSEIVKDDALSFFPEVPSLDESLEELSAAQRGTVTHRFMQFCDFSLAERDLEAEIARLTDASVFTRREAEAINRFSVKRFFEGDIYARMKRSLGILREEQFIIRFDDIDAGDTLKEIYRGTDGMLQGIADCLFEEPDGFVLVDYKTDRVKTAQELAERYSGQLTLYKAAFDALLDKPVKSAYIYSFRLGEGIEIKI